MGGGGGNVAQQSEPVRPQVGPVPQLETHLYFFNMVASI